jgi:hypothetical protein
VTVEFDLQQPPLEEQLAWEKRWGRVAGVAAALSAVLFLVSFVVELPALKAKAQSCKGLKPAVLAHTRCDEADTLHKVHQHASSLIGASIAQAIGLFLLVVALVYLYRVTRYRRVQTRGFVLALVIIGPTLVAVTAVLASLELRHVANQFQALPVAEQLGKAGAARAKHLVNQGPEKALGIISPLSIIAFVGGLAVLNLNAIRAGTLSTFVGIVGIIAAVLFVVPIGPPQLLSFFWLAFLAATFLDMWPGGRGPAWASGQAERWPNLAEKRAIARGEPLPERPQRRTRGQQAPPPAPKPEPEGDPSPSASARKRKRKKRR